mmetsp:Transcript_1014/g.2632  ORF Transcript_1014/g.2632 Transcript_1014/m.2632 type:complete len:212 (-) Transcript_1014:93-728(-)
MTSSVVCAAEPKKERIMSVSEMLCTTCLIALNDCSAGCTAPVAAPSLADSAISRPRSCSSLTVMLYADEMMYSTRSRYMPALAVNCVIDSATITPTMKSTPIAIPNAMNVDMNRGVLIDMSHRVQLSRSMIGASRYAKASARTNGIRIFFRKYAAPASTASAIITRHSVLILSSKCSSSAVNLAFGSSVCVLEPSDGSLVGGGGPRGSCGR